MSCPHCGSNHRLRYIGWGLYVCDACGGDPFALVRDARGRLVTVTPQHGAEEVRHGA